MNPSSRAHARATRARLSPREPYPWVRRVQLLCDTSEGRPERIDGFRGEATVPIWPHRMTTNECRRLRRREVAASLDGLLEHGPGRAEFQLAAATAVTTSERLGTGTRARGWQCWGPAGNACTTNVAHSAS